MVYLQQSSLQEEHLVCIRGGPTQKALHSPRLPESTHSKHQELDIEESQQQEICKIKIERGR